MFLQLYEIFLVVFAGKKIFGVKLRQTMVFLPEGSIAITIITAS